MPHLHPKSSCRPWHRRRSAHLWCPPCLVPTCCRIGTPIAAQCATLDELAQAFNAFTGCSLRKAATHTCFLGGNLTSRILVYGDKARTDEDKEGRVFAARNAVLLDNMLKAIGLTADDVMLANFIPWRPPGNRAVTEVEARQCLPFAIRLLELARPRAILAFGGLAGQWLAGGEHSILKQRGKWLSIAAGSATIPMIATFHPDDLIKTPMMKRLAWADLLMFHDLINGTAEVMGNG